MSWYDRILRRKSNVPMETKGAAMDTTATAKFLSGAPSASGKIVTDTSAMSIAAAWGCMRVLSETIGAIPWALYEKDAEGNAQKVTDHPLAQTLAQPNTDMTSTEYRETKVLNLCQRGNAFSLIERSGKNVVALMPIKSALVEVKRKEGGNTSLPIQEGEPFYRISDRGRTTDYPRDKIWHVKGFGGDGLVGLSPLGAAREAMGVALATEEFGARFFSQGGMPSGTLTVPGWLDPKQREDAREMLNQLMGGLGSAHRFALFEGGMKPEPWGGMALEDMQFLTLRQFSVAEICRFYRVPPHMVADLSRSTFSNIEQQSQDFVQYTLLPYFVRFEASANKWLLQPDERDRLFLRFNFEGLLRGDSAARASFYNSALQNGWMNRNEVRAKENLDQVPGLDDYTVQSNMALMTQLSQMLTNGAKELREREVKLMERMEQMMSGGRAQIIVNPPSVTLNAVIEKSGAVRQIVERRDEDGGILAIRTEDAH